MGEEIDAILYLKKKKNNLEQKGSLAQKKVAWTKRATWT